MEISSEHSAPRRIKHKPFHKWSSVLIEALKDKFCNSVNSVRRAFREVAQPGCTPAIVHFVSQAVAAPVNAGKIELQSRKLVRFAQLESVSGPKVLTSVQQ